MRTLFSFHTIACPQSMVHLISLGTLADMQARTVDTGHQVTGAVMCTSLAFVDIYEDRTIHFLEQIFVSNLCSRLPVTVDV